MNRKVVGLACSVECDLDPHRHLSPWLASVLVDSDYRRRGIGSALAERVAEEASALGRPNVYLVTLDRQSFYRRLGRSMLEVTTLVRDLGGQRALADDGGRFIE